jgi:hypothetical protein
LKKINCYFILFLDKNIRTCDLVLRPDFEGFGFVLKKNKIPPHEIANISPDSPAALSGLQNGDLLLKINDVSVVNEKYPQVVVLVKNGISGGNGLTKLEVIRPEFFQRNENDIDQIESLNEPIKSSSLKSNDYFKGEGFKNKSVQSLPDYSNIDREDESSQPSISTNSRPINSSTKKAVSLSNLNSVNDKNVSKLGRIL